MRRGGGSPASSRKRTASSRSSSRSLTSSSVRSGATGGAGASAESMCGGMNVAAAPESDLAIPRRFRSPRPPRPPPPPPRNILSGEGAGSRKNSRANGSERRRHPEAKVKASASQRRRGPGTETGGSSDGGKSFSPINRDAFPSPSSVQLSRERPATVLKTTHDMSDDEDVPLAVLLKRSAAESRPAAPPAAVAAPAGASAQSTPKEKKEKKHKEHKEPKEHKGSDGSGPWCCRSAVLPYAPPPATCREERT